MARAIVGLAVLAAVLLVACSAPPAAAQYTVAPGGSYTVVVEVQKPADLKLYDGKWEIRAYYFISSNCFNQGSWWQSGNDWVYSGWYNDRVQPDSWLGEPTSQTFNINTNLVNNPRGNEGSAYPTQVGEDYEGKMGEIPVPGTVKLRTRFLIKEINPVFNEDARRVTFTVGGVTYQYTYTEIQYPTETEYSIGEGESVAIIDRDATGEYRIKIDQETTVFVDNSASASGTITISSPIQVNIGGVTNPEQGYELPLELKIAIAVVAVLAIAGAVAYLALRGRRGGELEVSLKEAKW